VRFLELIDTGFSAHWGSHGNRAVHDRLAKNVDQPITALLTDLKRRGILDDTLVVCFAELGRVPYHANANHADRNYRWSGVHGEVIRRVIA
jgi:membrane-anchored protein YejM (alkaline phosphatase superfamily)